MTEIKLPYNLPCSIIIPYKDTKIMIKTEPIVELTAKYELRDACGIMGVTASCLAKWTEKGVVKCGRKKLNGRRFWTGAELLRAWKAQM